MPSRSDHDCSQYSSVRPDPSIESVCVSSTCVCRPPLCRVTQTVCASAYFRDSSPNHVQCARYIFRGSFPGARAQRPCGGLYCLGDVSISLCNQGFSDETQDRLRSVVGFGHLHSVAGAQGGRPLLWKSELTPVQYDQCTKTGVSLETKYTVEQCGISSREE